MFLDKNFMRNVDLGLLLLRLTVGGLMLFHGISKVNGGVDFVAGMLEGMGLPGFIAYGAVVGELIASVMIICGIWTRVASVIFVVNMIVAIAMAHSTQIFTLDPNTGGWAIELPMLYLLGALVLCFTGAGNYAITRDTVFD